MEAWERAAAQSAAAFLEQEGGHVSVMKVGSEHLVWPGSLLERLQEMGYTIGQITDYPATAPVPAALPTFDIDFTFAGDCTLASFKGEYKPTNLKGHYAAHGPDWFFQYVKPIFQADDFTIVNLENVFTDRALAQRYKRPNPSFWFQAPSEYTQILTRGDVEAVSLANNHTLDYGEEGKRDTRAALDGAGVLWGDEDKTVYLEKNGYTVALVCTGLWDSGDVPGITKRLAEAGARSDFQIVFFHGGTEGVLTPEAWKVTACHALVDAGADLIIGNHPHVLQRRESYNGAEIVYSMGNFCFGGNNNPKNRTILYQLKLTVDVKGRLVDRQSNIIPCYVHTGTGLNNYAPAPISDPAQRQRVLEFMDAQRSSPY